MRPHTSLALVFVIGCAVGGAASRIEIPEARATDTPRWEYVCVTNPDPEQLAETGAKGWELTTSTPYDYGNKMEKCFKRPLP